MPDIARIQTNFSSGELDPTMRGRIDTGAYQNGARSLLNMALLNTGGTTRRPGTGWIADLGTTFTRLVPFDYDDETQFILAMQPSALKVYTLAGSLVQTLVAPWVLAEIYEVTFSQLADTVIFAHKNWMPTKVKRESDTTWTIDDMDFEESSSGDAVYQPYDNFSPPGTYIIPSAATGSITLTSNNPIFVAGHVGTRFKLYGTEVQITGYTSPTEVTGTVGGKLEGELIANAFQTTDNSKVITVTHVGHGLETGDSITYTQVDAITTQELATGGTVTTRVVTSAELNGARTITYVNDDTYTFTIAGSNALSTTDGGGANMKFAIDGLRCYDWLEQVFSGVRGYPRAVCFHEQRLWFGGSSSRPDGLWSSQIRRFFNFDVGEGSDNESIQGSIGSDLGSAVRHLVSNRHLQIFTGTKEFYCPPPRDTTLTPGTFRVLAQTAYGSGGVRPVSFDGATLFVQNNGKTIREFMYSDQEQAYNALAVSLLSGHLIKQPVDQSVLRGTTERGEQYAVQVNADGSLAVFNSARAEKLAGWVPWSTRDNDEFISVCTIGNQLFFTVLRNGHYHLEVFEADDSQTLDCASAVSGASSATWTLQARFYDQTVAVVADGFFLGEFEVGPAGELDLGDYNVTSLTVGFNYPVRIETLPPAIDTPRGQRHGAISRIAEVLVLFDTTHAVKVQGQRLVLRQVTDDVQAAPAAAGTYYRWDILGYSRQPTIVIEQDEPLALRILAIRQKVVV